MNIEFKELVKYKHLTIILMEIYIYPTLPQKHIPDDIRRLFHLNDWYCFVG